MQTPSKRGEIEVPDAIRHGIKEKHWKLRVVKIEKDQFYGDFGDVKKYEKLVKNTDWLNLL